MRRFRLGRKLHRKKEFNTEITEDTENAEKTKREEITKKPEERKNAAKREITRIAKKSTLLVAEPAIEDRLIGVDAAVAQKRPVAARFLTLGGIAFDDEDFFLVVRSFGDDLAKRIGDKGISPELQSRVAFFGFAFKSNAIDDAGVNSISDGVAALNRFPGVKLRG